MEGPATGWALLISDTDHRAEAVEKKVATLKGLRHLPKSLVRIVETIPVKLAFGHQPYHVFLKLEAESPDALLAAFAELEQGFSHVDGFI
jgi:hypothetical protein